MLLLYPIFICCSYGNGTASVASVSCPTSAKQQTTDEDEDDVNYDDGGDWSGDNSMIVLWMISVNMTIAFSSLSSFERRWW